MEEDPPPLPLSVQVIAGLFFVAGCLFAYQLISTLMAGKLSCHPGFLGIFIGRGLFLRQESWRIWALVSIWLTFALVVFLAILVLVFDVQGQGIGGQTLEEVPKMALYVGMALVFAVNFWSYRVLTNEKVRGLYRFHSLDKEKEEDQAEG